MLKKIYILFSLCILASCGTSSDNPEPVLEGGYKIALTSGSGFEMYTPASWSASGSENLPSPYMGEVALSLRASGERYGFANNLLILKKDLDTAVSSLQYSISNHQATKGKYLEYEKIDAYPINFGDTDTSRVYIFDAKYNKNIQKLRFIETAKMCGTTVYLLHFTIALDRSPNNYIKLLESFRCK